MQHNFPLRPPKCSRVLTTTCIVYRPTVGENTKEEKSKIVTASPEQRHDRSVFRQARHLRRITARGPLPGRQSRSLPLLHPRSWEPVENRFPAENVYQKRFTRVPWEPLVKRLSRPQWEPVDKPSETVHSSPLGTFGEAAFSAPVGAR